MGSVVADGDFPEPWADVGVVFVHGIGDQPSGSTLRKFQKAVLGALGDMLSGLDEEFSAQASGDREGSALRQEDLILEGHVVSRIDLAVADQVSSWFLAEAWWAESFSAPRPRRLATWLLVSVPWTLYRHAFRRRLVLGRAAAPGWRFARIMLSLIPQYGASILILAGLARALPWMILAIIFQAIVAVVAGLLLVPGLRRLATPIQRLMAVTLGDAYALVESPDDFQRMVQGVSASIDNLARHSRSVVVVAHSQGAAVVHEVLRAHPKPRVRTVISLGAGIDKLWSLRLMRKRRLWAVLAVARTGLTAVWLIWVAGLILLESMGVVGGQGSSDSPSSSAWYLYVIGPMLAATLYLPYVWPTLGLWTMQAEVSKELEESALPSSVHWLDLYASSDPVSSGPFAFSVDPERPADKAWWRYLSAPNRYRRALAKVGAVGGPPRIASAQVHNRASVVRDHTTYLWNVEQVIVPIIDHVSAFTALRLTRIRDGYVQRLNDAWTVRRWRVGWLVTIRVALVTEVIATGVVAYSWLHKWTLVLLAVSVLSLWFLVVVRTAWLRWDGKDQRSFLQNDRFPDVPAALTLVVFVLAPALVLSGAVVARPPGVPTGAGRFWLAFMWGVLLISCSLRQWRPVVQARGRIKRSSSATPRGGRGRAEASTTPTSS
jgi:hypothetical protein